MPPGGVEINSIVYFVTNCSKINLYNVNYECNNEIMAKPSETKNYSSKLSINIEHSKYSLHSFLDCRISKKSWVLNSESH